MVRLPLPLKHVNNLKQFQHLRHMVFDIILRG